MLYKIARKISTRIAFYRQANLYRIVICEVHQSNEKSSIEIEKFTGTERNVIRHCKKMQKKYNSINHYLYNIVVFNDYDWKIWQMQENCN